MDDLGISQERRGHLERLDPRPASSRERQATRLCAAPSRRDGKGEREPWKRSGRPVGGTQVVVIR